MSLYPLPDGMEFSPGWSEYANFISNALKLDETVLKLLPNVVRALEIGSFEGRSAAWMLTHFLTHPESTLTCVDPLPTAIYERFMRNMERISPRKPELIRQKSKDALPKLKGKYDFIYIDGDHSALGVLTDAVLAWPLLAPHGVMVFDDYACDRLDIRRPVDAFVGLMYKHIEPVFSCYQLAIRRRGE